MKFLLGLFLAALLFSGCSTVSYNEKRTAVITAFEPMVWVRTEERPAEVTGYESSVVGLDPHALSVTVAANALTKPIKVINGKDAGLLSIDGIAGFSVYVPDEDLIPKLILLGKQMQVDIFIVLKTSELSRRPEDIGVAALSGISLYKRNERPIRVLDYAIMELCIFDCRTHAFIRKEVVPVACQLDVHRWTGLWADFSNVERERILNGWESILREGVPVLLAKAQLSNARIPASLAMDLLIPNSEPTK